VLTSSVEAICLGGIDMNDAIARLRDSAGYAANTFERLWPRRSELRGCAEILADAIERAVEVGGAWSVTLDSDNVRLNVGTVRLLSMSVDQLWFAAVADAAEVPRWLEDISEAEFVYPSVPIPSLSLVTSSIHAGELPAAIRGAFLDYVGEAARRRRGRTLWFKAHAKGVVSFLNAYLGRTLPQPIGIESSDQDDAGDVDAGATSFVEGGISTVVLDRHERDPRARDACLKVRGVRCAVCGLAFGEKYGPLGDGFIEVHHLTPIAEADGPRAVDPAADLVPICPNCHRMLHRESPPLAPDALRRRMDAQAADAGRDAGERG